MINPFFLIIDPVTYRGVLFYSIVLLTVLSLISLITMIVHKTYIEIRETLCNRLKEMHHGQVREFLEGERKDLPTPSAKISFDCLADASISILATADAATADRIREELEKVGLVDHLADRAENSRSWVRRYLALERLGFLRYRNLRSFYRDMVEAGRDRRLLSKALWSLSYIATAADIELIWATLKSFQLSSGKFHEYVFTNMVSSLRRVHGDDRTVKILRYLVLDGNEDPALRRALVESCGKLEFPAFAPVAMEAYYADPDSPLMRMTSLRAAGELRADGICEILTPALGDTDWRIRLIAAQFAHLCAGSGIPRLGVLLRDANYHVRINAARVLYSLGEQGRAVLERACLDSDRFARDVSRYVLSGK